MYSEIILSLAVLGIFEMFLVPFALKEMKRRLTVRKAKKEGAVIAEIKTEGGTLIKKIVRSDEGAVEWNGKRFLTAHVQPLIDAETGLLVYRWDERDAYPEDFKRDLETAPEPARTALIETWLNPAAIEKMVINLAQVHGTSMFDKYFKLILIGLAGLGGLIFLLGGT